MITNYFALFIIVITNVILTFLSIMYVKTFLVRVVVCITIWVGMFFTGLGVINSFFDNFSYILSYILFIVLMTSMLLIQVKKSNERDSDLFTEAISEYIWLFKAVGMISLLAHLAILIYPDFRLFELFKFSGYVFDAGVFEKRLLLDNDKIYWIITRINVVTFPFFLTWIYTLRKKPIKFIGLYVFYNYIDFVKSHYISRSALLVIVIFIWIYLYEEEIFGKKILNIVLAVVMISAIPISIGLTLIRTGGEFSFKLSDLGVVFEKLIFDEAYCQQFLDVCNSFSNLSFIKMITAAITTPLFFLPKINFPVLAYSFTEKILGLSYGEANYYIMLPGAFGEGIMMFGKYLGWLYGAFIGFFVGFIYKKIKQVPYFKYWMVYFLLDYARAFRGGIQTFIIATINSLVFIIIVMFFVKKLYNGKHQISKSDRKVYK